MGDESESVRVRNVSDLVIVLDGSRGGVSHAAERIALSAIRLDELHRVDPSVPFRLVACLACFGPSVGVRFGAHLLGLIP
jgi:hypothetical protein